MTILSTRKALFTIYEPAFTAIAELDTQVASGDSVEDLVALLQRVLNPNFNEISIWREQDGESTLVALIFDDWNIVYFAEGVAL